MWIYLINRYLIESSRCAVSQLDNNRMRRDCSILFCFLCRFSYRHSSVPASKWSRYTFWPVCFLLKSYDVCSHELIHSFHHLFYEGTFLHNFEHSSVMHTKCTLHVQAIGVHKFNELSFGMPWPWVTSGQASELVSLDATSTVPQLIPVGNSTTLLYCFHFLFSYVSKGRFCKPFLSLVLLIAWVPAFRIRGSLFFTLSNQNLHSRGADHYFHVRNRL